jgi:hypothetical protein
MPTRQKLALFSVFAVSYVAVALGALRAYSSYRLFFETYDVTWAACDVWLWYVSSNSIYSIIDYRLYPNTYAQVPPRNPHRIRLCKRPRAQGVLHALLRARPRFFVVEAHTLLVVSE